MGGTVLEVQSLPIPDGGSFSTALGPGDGLALVCPSNEARRYLLRVLTGLDGAPGATVRVFGDDPAQLDETALSACLGRIGIVGGDNALISNLSLAENVLLPLLMQGVSDEAAWERLEQALRDAGFSGDRHAVPGAVDAESRRRAGLARVFAQKPALLIADAPLSGLDAAAARRLAAAFKRTRALESRPAVLYLAGSAAEAALVGLAVKGGD